ncbi:MAG: J domain-containing protein [Synechococcales cyanobacterium]|nr:J domain-containing protein [Cyanobacteria bacterium REEB444]
MTYCDRQRMKVSFEVLEIKPTATLDEVKDAYRDLAFIWQPDRYTHHPRLHQKAQEQFQSIHNAYQLLEFCLSQGQNNSHHPQTLHSIPPVGPVRSTSVYGNRGDGHRGGHHRGYSSVTVETSPWLLIWVLWIGGLLLDIT